MSVPGVIGSKRFIVFPKLFERPSMLKLHGGGIVIDRERKYCGKVQVFEVSYKGLEMSEALDVFTEAAVIAETLNLH